MDTPAAAAGDDLRLPAALHLLALRAAHVAAAADAERGAVVVTAALTQISSAAPSLPSARCCSPPPTTPTPTDGTAPRLSPLKSRDCAPRSLPSRWPHCRWAVSTSRLQYSPLLAAFAFAEAGVDAPPRRCRRWRAVGGLCASRAAGRRARRCRASFRRGCARRSVAATPTPSARCVRRCRRSRRRRPHRCPQ